MNQEINVRITGEAGQGIVSVGMMLCRMYKDTGRHVFAIQDYMSRIRGGNNYFQIRVADKPVFSPRAKADVIIALDKDAVAVNKSALAEGGLLILDAGKYDIKSLEKGWFSAPIYALAQAAGGPFYANSVALGMFAAMTCGGPEAAYKAIDKEFGGKGAEIVKNNKLAVRKGYDYVVVKIKDCSFSVSGAQHDRGCLLAGNEALALGAIAAGCKFYTAYPMSPSTGIMNTVADYAGKYGIIVEQAEDEIAAVNMAVGASFAGVRAMTASSGGGFALMCEGLSLAAMTETPLVIAVVMRPGPATGFPTRTAQEDLEFVLHAGHGEFARAVYTPGSPEECFIAAKRAFNTAERFQLPALILSDQYLAESFINIKFPDTSAEPPDRGRIFKSGIAPEPGRYEYSPDGVSPRIIPARSGALAVADSDEHGTESHITESAEVRVKMTRKRLHLKLAGLAKEILPPTVVNPGAKIMLCGFGSTLGVMREACAAAKGAGFIHYSQVWPFPEKSTLTALKGAERVLTMENNASGQLARLIRRETGLKPTGSILKYDGRPFTLDEVAAALEEGK
ncbi:MAG: hypothetical protein A2021_05445 [Elusimicrobia bacterium GWF2_52_66]|nr:MAG: hypothetical protein A2X33_07480 [Elusimicrobia bacterium GWA2_51_34]OGR85731.1 MAG: hypothetical protein A2021_05445 [Elusimicrobia bacterium GWF2_52_66]HAF94898.1 2-oxoacid:acceptor oxidoreductase subunit alpha [Elusimicrobiota bacterium]HCE97069.1 2-oxoacid:acceptor oxidoreductase subunit alpha [Elusimicrobiota bacterium]